MKNESPESPAPWWKYGHVWLVVSGPAIVVVAGFITLYLAVTRPDPLVTKDYYREGLDINKHLKQESASMAPALQGRNHAQTGGIPSPDHAVKP